MDQRRLPLVDLAPQVADARFDHVAVTVRVVVPPDMVQDLAFADHPARVHHQEPQQPVLSGRQRDDGTLSPDLVRILVQLEVGDAQPRTGSVRPSALQHRPDAAKQLVQAERLRDVIVPAHVEPPDAGRHLVPGAQEDHRNLGTPGPYPAERLERFLKT